MNLHSKRLQIPLSPTHRRSRKTGSQRYFYSSQRNFVTEKLAGKSHRVHRDSVILSLNNNLENIDLKTSNQLGLTWFQYMWGKSYMPDELNIMIIFISFYKQLSNPLNLLQDHTVFQMLISHKSPNSALTYNPLIFSNFLINNRSQNLNYDTVSITSRYWGHFHETN